MGNFFTILALVSEGLLVATLLCSHFAASWGLTASFHIFLGLASAFLAILTHCLVFAIFTGSGKDAREITEDLFLRPDFVRETKRFRRENFPIALYGILAILFTVILGGTLGSTHSSWLRLIHLATAWVTILYNGSIFFKEALAVRENTVLLRILNAEALEKVPKTPIFAEEDVPLLALTKDSIEWGTHVHALGKFLCFLAYNVWLPYLYLRFVMGYLYLQLWPFIVLFSVLLLGGAYLRWKYQSLQGSPSH